MKHEEFIMQVQVCEWARQTTDLPFFATFNERECKYAEAERLRRAGRTAGVLDLIFYRANKTYHGLYVELKYGKNKPSIAQLEFIHRLIAEDYAAHVCYSADEAILVIKSFYGI